MAEPTDAEFEAAEARGLDVLVKGPRAVSAHYDGDAGRLVIEIMNGCSYAVPASLIQDLKDATTDQLGEVQVDGLGLNLSFPTLEVDLFVPAVIAGLFGTREWMRSELARVAGRSTSEAKADAARRNGRQGGRPRKTAAA